MAAGTGSLGPDCFLVPPQPRRLPRQALHQGQRRADRERPGVRVGGAIRDHAGRQLGRLHLQRRRHLV